MVKVVFVIAKEGFRDEELLGTKAVLEKVAEVHIASTAVGTCTGKLGATVQADLSIEQALASVGQFSSVIFIGGPGVQTLFGHTPALDLAKKAHHLAAVRVLGAICWAPCLLARANVLGGAKITCWDDGKGTQFHELKAAGATILPQHVVTDGKLVTADGPNAAKDFGKAIVAALHR